MLLEILVGLICIALYVYFMVVNNDYWKKKGVVHIKATFPLGIVNDEFFGRRSAGEKLQQIYKKYKAQKLRYVGGYIATSPVLIILDLDLCKHILTKDFNNFTTRELVPSTYEIISKHLFSLEGHAWREMRVKLTPTFTSGKMKNMSVLMQRCAEQLQEYIDLKILPQGRFQVKDLIARFTTDIIATCAFGLEVNTIKHEDNSFFSTTQLIFKPKRSHFIKFLLNKYFPKLVEFLKLDMYDPKVKDLFGNLIKDTVKYRQENNIVRNDFVDLMLKVKEDRSLDDDNPNSGSKNEYSKPETFAHRKGDNLTIDEMTAQAFVFFAAGFETAASTTSFCLFELAKNQQAQRKLREEVDQVLSRYEGKICYQAIQEMHYMEQVMNETLRMYASLPFLTRVCTENYEVPGTSLVLEKGVRCTMPVYAFHHDENIYPDPYKFDPDRFSEENVKNRHHYSFLPFGEGPRNCIEHVTISGLRFGKLQVKMGLAAILSRYEISSAPDTPSNLELNPLMVFTTPKEQFSLNISARS